MKMNLKEMSRGVLVKEGLRRIKEGIRIFTGREKSDVDGYPMEEEMENLWEKE